MNITEISYSSDLKQDKTAITWLDSNDANGDDKHRVESHIPPLESFTDALQDLKPDFLKIAELPESYGNTIRITKVTVKKKGDVSIYVIHARKELVSSEGVVLLKTPPKPDGSEEESRNELDPDTITKLHKLEEEAVKYVEGNRVEQPELEGME